MQASLVDQHLTETESIVTAVLFIQEEADPPELERLHPATIALLYIAKDRLRAAGRALTSAFQKA